MSGNAAFVNINEKSESDQSYWSFESDLKTLEKTRENSRNSNFSSFHNINEFIEEKSGIMFERRLLALGYPNYQNFKADGKYSDISL